MYVTNSHHPESQIFIKTFLRCYCWHSVYENVNYYHLSRPSSCLHILETDTSHFLRVRYSSNHLCNISTEFVNDACFCCDGECATLHGTGRNWGICVVVTMTTCEFVIYSGEALRGLSSWCRICSTHTHTNTRMCTCCILHCFKPQIKHMIAIVYSDRLQDLATTCPRGRTLSKINVTFDYLSAK